MSTQAESNKEAANLLERVQKHLENVEADPEQPVDAALLKQVRILVTRSINPPLVQVKTTLDQLSRLLTTIIQRDTAPLLELTSSFVNLPGFSFRDALVIDPPIRFENALQSGYSPLLLMILEILGKASGSQVDINWVAGKSNIVQALIRLWLRISDTGVSQAAGKVFTSFLNAPGKAKPTGHVDAALDENLMWRRVFRDRDVYKTIFEECTLSNVGHEGQLSSSRKTIAQGRLQDWLLEISTDAVRTTQISQVERQYGVQDGGLLEFAAVRMVDYKEDDLMRSTLISFCTNLISQVRNEEQHPFDNLAFLKKYDIHRMCMSYFLDTKEIHSAWTLESSASYIAAYCRHHREDFLRDSALSDSTVSIITRQLSIFHRLLNDHVTVLAALPRSLLLINGGASVLNRLPSHTSYPSTVQTLASALSYSDYVDDRIAARAVYYLYAKANPNLWEDMVQLATTAALFEGATAANELIANVISSSWERLPETLEISKPFAGLIESALASKCNNGQPLPQSGAEVILSAPALQIVVPYLMARPQEADRAKYRNMSKEHREIIEKLSEAKHKALRLLTMKVKEMPPSEDIDQIAQAMERRLEEGPMGLGAGSGVEPTFYGALGAS